MKGPLNLANAIHSIRAETARPLRRRRVVVACIVAWTVLAGLALWWLLRASAGPSMLIIHQGDSLQNSLQPAATERFHAWFKADMGIQRVYPWILLGPYVALLALYFPLERGRLRLSLPLSLAACAVFVAASHEINTRTSVAEGDVTIVTRQFGPRPLPGSHG